MTDPTAVLALPMRSSEHVVRCIELLLADGDAFRHRRAVFCIGITIGIVIDDPEKVIVCAAPVRQVDTVKVIIDTQETIQRQRVVRVSTVPIFLLTCVGDACVLPSHYNGLAVILRIVKDFVSPVPAPFV